MSRQFAFLVFLAFCMAVPVNGISCYYGTTEILHSQQLCIANYVTNTGKARFGGLSTQPKESPYYDFEKEEDCQLQRGVKTKSGDIFNIWFCVCYDPMCNFPFSYKEFSARGYTLRPSYVPRINGDGSPAED